jgi:hypothetical protein
LSVTAALKSAGRAASQFPSATKKGFAGQVSSVASGRQV